MSEEKGELVATTTLVTCDMLNQQVIFHFGEAEPLRKYLKPYVKENRLKDIMSIIEKDKNGTVLGKTLDLGKGTLIYLYSLPHNEMDYSTLCHEIYHAACMIMKKVGIEFSTSSEECYAYLIGFLSEEILHELKEKKLISFS